MNVSSNAMPKSQAAPQVGARAEISPAQSFYWSVRRELWEFRSIYLVQLAAAGIFLFGFLLKLVHLPEKMRSLPALSAMQQRNLIEQPYAFAAGAIMAIGFLVGIFYALEALQSERRDRSILFWKSLPVSDVTAVLAKASIPLVIIPLLSFVVAVVTELIMLLLSDAVLLASGINPISVFSHLPLLQIWVVLGYHLLVLHSLGFAPLYAWLLLVSGWARRMAFLWAALPLIALAMIGKALFEGTFIGGLLFSGTPGGDGFTGGNMPMHPMTRIDPTQFFADPGVWIGLAVAAGLLAATIRLRRYREPN
jgi:ABC-2 type transport system permease protein